MSHIDDLEQEVYDRIKQLYLELYNCVIEDDMAEEVWTIAKRLKAENWI